MQSTSLGLIYAKHTEVFACHRRVWLEQTQKCPVTLNKWTKLRGWLRLQRCKHMTDENQTRVASSAALPHLHTVPWSILTTVVASVLEAALKVAMFWNLNAHLDIWTNRITILSVQCVLTCCICVWLHLILLHYTSWYTRGLTLRNSFLSTCSLPSTSSILKAIWNPVCGSATAMHCQLSELNLNSIENPHRNRYTWLVGQSSISQHSLENSVEK